MLTNEFKGLTLSRLGFGTMRLPVMNGDAAAIDEKQVDEMVDYAISHGINYLDTAYPYHGGMSEKVIGRSLFLSMMVPARPTKGACKVVCSQGKMRYAEIAKQNASARIVYSRFPPT